MNSPAALTSHSPWDLRRQIWAGSCSSATDISAALALAQHACTAWSLDHDGRRAALTRFASVLIRRREEIIELLIAEAGKVQNDAAAEADALVAKIAITLDQGLARTPLSPVPGPGPGPSALSPPGSGVPCLVWRARGVAAVLGPFNFPLHLLHGLVVPALAVGCTVVAKPSERCPGLGELYRSALAQAGLASMCGVIQGGPQQVRELLAHDAVSTVAAVGSYATGQALAQLLSARPEVVLALELGGVNQALVLEDADLGACAKAVSEGAWRMAGQRCTATRIVHVPRAREQELLAQLVAHRTAWIPDGSAQAQAGPLISRAAQQRHLATYATEHLPVGLTVISGAVAPASGPGAAVEPLLLRCSQTQARQDARYREEQFSPALIVDPYDDLGECLMRMGDNPYRLSASVFTADPQRFLACARVLPYGQVNHNRSTAGARSDQPFGGLGRSGNGRPAALAACAIFADETVIWPAG